jgi:hypothetical protein
MRRSMRAILYLGDGYELSKTMATLRPRLGDDALAAAIERGRPLTLQQGISVALDESDR